MKFFGGSEGDQHTEVAGQLRERIAGTGLPPHVKEKAGRELELLERISPSTSEYTIGLTYIEYLISLPWNKSTSDNLDIDRVEKILNKDHYGLQKIKDRILEYLAVKKLRLERNPRILVIDDEEAARKNLEHVLTKENYTVVTVATGMEAVRRLEQSEFDVVLTDLKMEKIDGMDILKRTKSGHPHTEVIMITGYATIASAVEAMKKGAFHYIAKPFKLDDVRATVKQAIDKKALKKEAKGSVLCASALLEVLDPEQNSNFTDHYLDVPFDLSNVMFIITANISDNIFDALRDRMEVILFSGYTEEEKANIASQFLIPKQIKEAGLSGYHIAFAWHLSLS